MIQFEEFFAHFSANLLSWLTCYQLSSILILSSQEISFRHYVVYALHNCSYFNFNIYFMWFVYHYFLVSIVLRMSRILVFQTVPRCQLVWCCPWWWKIQGCCIQIRLWNLSCMWRNHCIPGHNNTKKNWKWLHQLDHPETLDCFEIDYFDFEYCSSNPNIEIFRFELRNVYMWRPKLYSLVKYSLAIRMLSRSSHWTMVRTKIRG